MNNFNLFGFGPPAKPMPSYGGDSSGLFSLVALALGAWLLYSFFFAYRPLSPAEQRRVAEACGRNFYAVSLTYDDRAVVGIECVDSMTREAVAVDVSRICDRSGYMPVMIQAHRGGSFPACWPTQAWKAGRRTTLLGETLAPAKRD